LVGVAVKVTDAPLQLVCEPEVMAKLTAGVTVGLTVMVYVSGVPVQLTPVTKLPKL
jgi:hypothetical protein